MDIRDRVVGDQPNDFLHKIASIVPGYSGYVDRERRRDADKLLRMQLARQYTEQRDRLNRAQQTLTRAGHFEQIAELDRLTGVLQRFIDRLSTATYGYTGLFDPVKVEAQDLDQIYAFDMALADGVNQVSSAVDAVESAATGEQAGDHLAELPAAFSRLSGTLDDLNRRLNQRSDLLTSGQRLTDTDYRALLGNLSTPPAAPPSGDPAANPGSAGTPTTDISLQPAPAQPGGVDTNIPNTMGEGTGQS